MLKKNFWRRNKSKEDVEHWLDTRDDILRRRLRKNVPPSEPSASQKQKRAKKSFKFPKKVTIKIPRPTIPKSVTFSLKKPKLPKNLPKIRATKQQILIILLIAIVVMVGLFFLAANIGDSPSDKQAKKEKEQQASQAKPNFTPLSSLNLASQGKNKDSYTYNPDKKVVSFTDDYYGKKVIITQQSLAGTPAVDDPTVLLKASGSIGAKDSISTDLGQFYYVQVPDSEAQLGVLKYKELLVFVRTEVTFDQEDFTQYLKNLTIIE
jgi:hypothetical protein